MPFELPALPFSADALAPHISEETLGYHHGKHHQAYVTNLNKLTAGTDWESKSLEDIILAADGGLFNNAAQVWNHTFYWNCLAPKAGGEPTGEVSELINTHFGSFDAFKTAFTQAAMGQFGSGWAWLVTDASGKASIVTTANAGNPMTDGLKPLMTCDVWEHAYYVDTRNNRGQYLENFWALVNWDFVNKNISS